MMHQKNFILILIFLLSLFNSIQAQNTYYVDATKGDDSFTGTSPLNAWKTVSRVNNADLGPGDSVLFKRKEIWRGGNLVPKSGSESGRIYYGAYGRGQLPLLLGSENMNKISDWKMTSPDVWVCTKIFPVEIGNIIFDNEHHTGIKKWNEQELKVQDDFYYHIPTKELKVYSSGNPAIRHKIIECALRKWMVEIEKVKYVTFENLAFKYGGGHGFAGESSAHLTIRNCELSWIGGGGMFIETVQVRFGNAIEFWRNATDNLVENNKIWEIYDTAVTNQSLYEGIQKNIVYRNNVIWNCGMAAIEVWNQDPKGITKGIWFENNTCVDIGYGWGKRDALHTGSCFISFDNNSSTDSVFIRNNIFVNPSRFFYFIEPENTFLSFTIDNNCYSGKTPVDTFYYAYNKKNLITLKDIESYRQKTGNDRNSILISPSFVDESNHNYDLRKKSPCRDAGAFVENPYDFAGNTRPAGKTFDIGAFEYKK